MKLAVLAIFALVATVCAQDDQVTGNLGYLEVFDVPKDSWYYVELMVTDADFGGVNATDNYSINIATDITELFTAQLWFGSAKVTDNTAANEIDPDATAMGRGNRDGTAALIAAGTYYLSVYGTCEACNTVTTELELYLQDANNNRVPFVIVHNKKTITMEVNEGDIDIWGMHTGANDIYVFARPVLSANSITVAYSLDAMPTVAASDGKYPDGSAIDGDWDSPAIPTMAGTTYFGTIGEKATAGGINYALYTGIDSAPDAGFVNVPSILAIAIAAVLAALAL